MVDDDLPQIKTLFGPEPRTFWIVLAIFLAQVTIAYFMRDASWWILLPVAYVFGGTVNHSLQLAAHELSHNLAFETVAFNKSVRPSFRPSRVGEGGERIEEWIFPFPFLHSSSPCVCGWAGGCRMLAIFANLVTGVPSSMTFIKYHMDHHRVNFFFPSNFQQFLHSLFLFTSSSLSGKHSTIHSSIPSSVH